MNAKIYSNKEFLGTIILRVGDYHMGGLCGEFVSSEYYLKHIRQAVWTFNETDHKNFNEWEALNFKVKLDNGFVLEPVGGICIYDYPEFLDEPIQIEIAGVDTAVINRYFDTSHIR